MFVTDKKQLNYMLISRLESSIRVQNVVLSNSKEIQIRKRGTKIKRMLNKLSVELQTKSPHLPLFFVPKAV